MRRRICHRVLGALVIMLLGLTLLPAHALAANEYTVQIVAQTGGTVRVQKASGDELAYVGHSVHCGPYTTAVPLPPVRLSIDSIDDNYYYDGRTYRGRNMIDVSRLTFSPTTEAGDLGTTSYMSPSTNPSSPEIVSYSFVLYRFAERTSKLTFVGNAPRGATVSDVPEAMTLRAVDKPRQALSSVPACTNARGVVAYWFDGWNTKADGSGTAFASLDDVYDVIAGDGVRAFARANGSSLDMTLYAQWARPTYEIRYDGGASDVEGLPVNPQSAVVGVAGDLAPAPTRPGHVFVGWTTDDGEVVASTSDLEAFVSAANRTVTLTATWRKTYTVLLFEHAEDEEPVATVSAVEGTEQVLPTPNRQGYAFVGWVVRTSPDVSARTTAKLDDLAAPGGKVEVDASWDGLDYLVAYATAGGLGSIEPQRAKVGVAASLATGDALSLAGHDFGGWLVGTPTSAGTPVGLVTTTADLDKLVETKGQTVTVHALWLGYYTLSFSTGTSDDVADMPANQKVMIDAEATGLGDGAIPRRAGHVFAGWMVGGETVVTTADVVRVLGGSVQPGATPELVATWTKRYDVSFSAGEGALVPDGIVVPPALASVSVGAGIKLDAPTNVPEGWTFVGWFAEGTDDAVTTTAQLDDAVVPGGTVELVASWTKHYTIVYDRGDGSDAMTLEVDSGSWKLEVPERDGHSFDGWTYEHAGVPVVIDDPATLDALAPAAGVVTLTAGWTAYYHVVYDAAGGAIDGDEAVIVAFGGVAELAVANREHHAFAGWYRGEGEAARRVDALDAAFERTVTPGETVRLTAHWLKRYNVTFDTGGIGVAPGVITGVVEGAGIAFAEPTGHDGWRFDGWYLGNERVTNSSQLDGVGAGSTVTLVARWTKTYVVSLVAGLGDVEPSSLDVAVGEARTLPVAIRAGYRFDGWVAADGSPVSSTAELDEGVEPGGTVFVRATWTKLYTVRLDAAGGVVDVESLSVATGEDRELPTPSREGWVFAGWTTADGMRVGGTGDLDNIVGAGASIVVRAEWHKRYTVRLDAAGGVVAPESIAVVADGGDGTWLPIPSRHGYRFDGWYTEVGLVVTSTTALAGIAEPGGIVTVRARWRATYSVELYERVGDAEPLAVVDAVAGEPQQLMVPARAGYAFVGWTMSNNVTLAARATSDLDAIAEAGSVLRLYPSWRGLVYVIDYDTNGGTGFIASQYAVVGEHVALASGSTLVRGGYVFSGWARSSSAGGETVSNTEDLEGAVTMAGQHVSVVATWIEHAPTFTVRYAAGASGNDVSGMPAEESFVVGSDLKLADGFTPTRAGWAFDGWALASGGVADGVETAADVVKLLNRINDGDVITVVATWRKAYRIAFFQDYEGGVTVTRNVIAGDGVALEVPARANYRFAAWSTSEGATVASSADADALALPGGTLALHARWLKTYTVILNDVRTGVVDIVAAVEDTPATFAAPKPDEGFIGWNTSSDGSGQPVVGTADLDALVEPGGIVSVFAQWKNETIDEPIADHNLPSDHEVSDTPADPDGGNVLAPTVPAPYIERRTSGPFDYVIDESIQRREVPSEIANMAKVMASKSATSERTYPPSAGRASRIEALIEAAESNAGVGGTSEQDAPAPSLEEVANRSTWVGAATMAVVGSATIVGMSVLGSALGGGAAAGVATTGAASVGGAAPASAKLAAAGKKALSVLREVLGRIFSW